MYIAKLQKPNLLKITNITVDKTAKLPYQVVKGSEKSRMEMADRFSMQLREGLDKVSSTRECKLSDFVEIINKIIEPHKINFNILPLKNKFTKFLEYTAGYISQDLGFDGKVYKIGNAIIDDTSINIKGFEIHLPLNKNNTVIRNKFSAFHEARHLFDYICNPKTLGIWNIKIIDDDKKLKAYKKAYSAFIDDFNFLGFWKKKAAKNLSKLSDEEAIDCLKSIRNTLKSEINAYRDTSDYTYKYPVVNFFEIMGNNDFMLFHDYPKKLKYANKLLKDRLQKARGK